MEVDIQQVQIVLFYNFWKSSNLFKIADSFDKKFGNLFDGGQKSVLPVNEHTPPEVPRIILSSQNGNYQFQLSLLRANLIIQNDVSSKMEKSIELAEKISEVSLEKYSWTINRIGFVVKTVRECENGALKFLDEQYISNKLQKEEKQKEIHSLAKENWENELVNQWIRLKADGNYLNIIVDRNIVPNDDRELSQKNILSYLKISADKIYKIIDGIMN